jgi:hypothetical protein
MPMTMSIPERERRCGRFELIAERYERRSLHAYPVATG